ncbi:Uncharacterised protein [Chlamydia trachomatis]|nr:Uncharacterised protein [Chlamydia trachomatis]
MIGLRIAHITVYILSDKGDRGKMRQERIREIPYTLLLRYREEGVTIDTPPQKFLDQ